RLCILEQFLITSPHDVVDLFFASWPIDLIFRLRATSMTLFCAVEAYRLRTWNPVGVLEPFFADVRSFLAMLDKCDGVVSGSQVVRLLQRAAFPDPGSDLDIFVPRHGLLRMGRWLKRHGYVYQSSGRKHVFFDVEVIRSASMTSGAVADGPDTYPSSSRASHFATYHFIREEVRRTADGSVLENVVQVVVVDTLPVQYIINNFHSTGVMNWFTGKYVVSLFPRSTFVHRMSYSCQDLTRSNKDWVHKYRSRGFEVVLGGGAPSKESAEMEVWERFVGDPQTWVMPFAGPGCGLQSSNHIYEQPRIRFEVIPYYSGVVPAGSYVRIAVPFIY
ncbi:hypothetical protein LXA43DRAFT_867886, partial [Ganoderma leucocontextum]